MKINLMRLLCLRSHCLAVLAFDEATTAIADAQTAIELGLQMVNKEMRCGVCESEEVHFEIEPTHYDSIAEATPHLIDEQRKNLEAHAGSLNLRRAAMNN